MLLKIAIIYRTIQQINIVRLNYRSYLIITQVKRCVDRLKRLEIDVDLFLLSFLRYDRTAVYYQAIGRYWKQQRWQSSSNLFQRQINEIINPYYLLPLVYNFNRCCTEVIAPSTDNLFTRDLMLDAVPNSSANILLTLDIWSFGGIIREIMLVPFLKQTHTQLFINFLYFTYSISLRLLLTRFRPFRLRLKLK